MGKVSVVRRSEMDSSDVFGCTRVLLTIPPHASYGLSSRVITFCMGQSLFVSEPVVDRGSVLSPIFKRFVMMLLYFFFLHPFQESEFSLLLSVRLA